MNIRDFEYISAIARLGSMSRAAIFCRVNQSTLSIQLKKLEAELGLQIFERTQKKLFPSKKGLEIIRIANQILKSAEEIKSLARESQDPLTGEITIGAFPTLAPYWFPVIVPLIKEEFKNLKIRLVEEKTGELIKMLKGGEVDCAALALPIEKSDFSSNALFDEPFFLTVQKQHRLAKEKLINSKSPNLLKENLLLLEEGHCMRGQALQFCSTQGIEESESFHAASLETLRNMVRAGEGITIIPKLAVDLKDRNLKYIPFDAKGPSRTIGLFWRKGSSREVLMQRLSEALSF